MENLAKALVEVQKVLVNTKKTQENPFYKSKYADIADIWDTIRKPLTDNGLAISQVLEPNPDMAIVKTILLHISGEKIESTIAIKPTKADPQGLGSAITYARRYALSAIIGVASEEDDDGNNASNPAKQNGETKKYTIKTPDAPATEKQVKLIHTLASKKNISSERIKARAVAMFKKDSSKDLTMGEASKLIDYYQNYTGEPEAIPEATPEDFGIMDQELPV